MGFWDFLKPKPHKLIAPIRRTESEWRTSFHKDSEYFRRDKMELKVYTCGSLDLLRKEFRMKYPNAKVPWQAGLIGLAVKLGPNKKKYHIWLVGSMTNKRRILLSLWYLGHELLHCLNWSSDDRYPNPDQIEKKEYYL